MNNRIDWREIADSDDILSIAESQLEQALAICDDGPFEDRYDACQCLMRFGKASVEAGQWRGALWLKRLNELRFRQFGSEGIDEIAAFLHPRLHGVLAERLQANGRSPEEWQADPLNVTRKVFADQHDECVIPGLLMATQIRFMVMKNSDDDALVAQTAALEADMYADAGCGRDAEESAEFAAEIIRQGKLDHEGIGLIASSLLVTSDKCDAHGEADVAGRLREMVRSICDEEHEEYAVATVSLANAYMKAGDFREAYRLAQDADRPEVVKDAAGRQLVAFFVSFLKVELTGDMRLISTDVDAVADELGGPTDAMKTLRSHFLKIMNGEKLTDADLLEGAHHFVECARHSESMKASEGAVSGYVGALKQLLSMGDFSLHASYAKELLDSAKAHGDSSSDDLRTELESLERMVKARCDESKAPGAMQVPKATFGLDSIAAKLADRLSGNEPK